MKTLQDAIRQAAHQSDLSTPGALAAAREAIEAGYHSPDPQARAVWAALFPLGKPTPEEFIRRVAQYLAENE